MRGELDATDVPLAAAVATPTPKRPRSSSRSRSSPERSGVPLALLEAVAREGLLLPRVHDGVERYTASDIAIVQQGLSLLERASRSPSCSHWRASTTDATRDIAEQAVALFDDHVRQPLRLSRPS